MKKTAMLINTSRGPIVNEEALIAALKSGTIAHAGSTCTTRSRFRRPSADQARQRHVGAASRLRRRGGLSHFLRRHDRRHRAWLDGKPINVINPEALKPEAQAACG